EAVFGIDLAPGVGASSNASGRAATRRLSLGLVGTLSSRLHGLELSFGANIQRVSVCGAQIALGANIARGPVHGLQYASFNLAKGELRGAQLGMANITAGRFDGVQAGMLNVTTGELHGPQPGIANYIGGALHGPQAGIANYVGRGLTGVQAGVANFAGGRVTGVQAGVANVNAGGVHGLQAGVANYAGGVRGLEAGVANLSIGKIEGAQIGVFNLATGGVGGAQIGVANISAREVRGVQFGVVNYAERSKASIGLLSIVPHGRTSFDLTGAVESGTLIAAVTHGGEYVHNTYGLGMRTGKDGQRLAVQVGIGVRVLHLPRVHLDVEAIETHYVKDWNSSAHGQRTFVPGGRVPLTLVLVGGLGLMIAPSYQVMITQDAAERTQSIFGQHTFHNGKTRTIGYPGLTLGLRWEFDHGV
ncbi:MAG TPA: hypothetical protein VG963_34020, partial [Polyangiaceae bacterium]|nr:hypothetical protein [Polyangiaceae bacterium]